MLLMLDAFDSYILKKVLRALCFEQRVDMEMDFTGRDRAMIFAVLGKVEEAINARNLRNSCPPAQQIKEP